MPETSGSPVDPQSSVSPPAGESAARITELEDEVRALRKELWQSRDATIGATATAGSYKARNVELEMLVHQLRAELARLDSALKGSRQSVTGRVNAALGIPRRVARKLLRP